MPNEGNIMRNGSAAEIQEIFITNEITLSLAESCTGGALAAELTTIAGCSHYFLGSVVAYANAAKTTILKVEAELIEKYGAVSREVVLKMAEGVQKLTNSDVSLAVSGIAGPGGGSSDKPVGTIWMAIYEKSGECHSEMVHFKGNRQEIICKCINWLLGCLMTYLELKEI